jgi:hypothetical protein
MESCEAATGAAAAAMESDTHYFRRILAQVLLQEIATGRYFQASGLWSSHASLAMKFRTASEARECATQHSLTNVQVVMMHEFRECEIFPLNNKLVRVWPGEGRSKTELCPKGLLISYSEAGEAKLVKAWDGTGEGEAAASLV